MSQPQGAAESEELKQPLKLENEHSVQSSANVQAGNRNELWNRSQQLQMNKNGRNATRSPSFW